MIKIAGRFLLFTLLLLISYLLFLFLIPALSLNRISPNISVNTGGPGQSLLRLRDAATINNVDILFSGSSHAARGFDPRIFADSGFNVLNLGSGLQTPENTYYLLQEYLPRTHPKTVVMEVFWDVLEYDHGTESAIDLITNSPVSANMTEMALATKNYRVIASMTSNYLFRMIHPVSESLQQSVPHESYVSGGYCQSEHDDQLVLKSIATLKKRSVQLKNNQIEYLRKIIILCNTRQIPLIFVTAPVPEEYIRSITNYEDINKQLRGLFASENKTWINFNDSLYRSELQLETARDFNDLNHLSQRGVEKFNRLLIRTLQKKISFH